MKNTIKPAVVALIAASVVGAGATVQALASGSSGDDDLPRARSSQAMNDDVGRHRSTDQRDDRRDMTLRGEVERRDDHGRSAEFGHDQSRHLEPGDDHGIDVLEPGDDHGIDVPEPGDDHGIDALEPGDDHGDDGVESGDDHGIDALEPGDDHGGGGDDGHGGDDR